MHVKYSNEYILSDYNDKQTESLPHIFKFRFYNFDVECDSPLYCDLYNWHGRNESVLMMYDNARNKTKNQQQTTQIYTSTVFT